MPRLMLWESQGIVSDRRQVALVAEDRMKLGITGPAGKAYGADTQTASVGGYCAIHSELLT